MDGLRIVGIAGKAGAGKDTLASHLSLEFDLLRIGLADAVKGALDDLGGPTKDVYKRLKFPVREGWQKLGTECRLATGNITLWVDVLLAKAIFARQFLGISGIVVPDLRFPAEAARFRAFSRDKGAEFLLIRIDRPTDGDAGEIDRTHASETRLDAIRPDLVVINDGTPANMVDKVRPVLSDFLL